MRHSSLDLFAASETRARATTELVTGRFGELDLADPFADAHLRTALSLRPVRQDDRPAGRMTLLAAK